MYIKWDAYIILVLDVYIVYIYMQIKHNHVYIYMYKSKEKTEKNNYDNIYITHVIYNIITNNKNENDIILYFII